MMAKKCREIRKIQHALRCSFCESLPVLELLEEPSWKSFTPGSRAGSLNEIHSQIRYTNHPNAMTQPGKVAWLMVKTETLKFV